METNAPKPTARAPRDGGASLVEYALLVAVIAVVCIVGLHQLGGASEDKLTEAAVAIGEEGAGSTGAGSGGSGSSDTGTSGGSTGSSTSGADQAAQEAAAAEVAAQEQAALAEAVKKKEAELQAEADAKAAAEAPAPKDPEAAVTAATGTGRLYWWDESGRQGEWVASTTFSNGWERPSYLTIEVVRVFADGKTSKDKVNNFYVPAKGTATLDQWSNWLAVDDKGGANVVEVRFEVVQITTSDADWKPRTYAVKDGATSRAVAPPVK